MFRIASLATALLLSAGILSGLWYPGWTSSHLEAAEPITNHAEVVTSKTNNFPITNQVEDVMALFRTSNFVGMTAEQKQLLRSKLTRDQQWELSAEARNIILDFYGHVVDQDGKPLSGVQVVASARQWFYTPKTGVLARFPKTIDITDENGNFKLIGSTGDCLTIDSLKKDGYESEFGEDGYFMYGKNDDAKSSLENRTSFRMWKDGTGQAVITGSKKQYVIPDGRYYTIDLKLGEIKEGEHDGDLRIYINQPPHDKLTTRYDWSSQILPINGGIMEESNLNDRMAMAPEDGYQILFGKEYHSTDERWSSDYTKRFYFKSRNGQVFGRFEIMLFANKTTDHQGSFLIRYTINPAGSRVLRGTETK
jgi:hypothetical protein